MLKTSPAVRYTIILYSAFTLSIALLPARAGAQGPPVFTPSAPAEPPPDGVATVGDDYHVEVSAGLWFTFPSTVLYSDTETVAGVTTRIVTGTNIDFRKDLGLTRKTFPELHATIRLAPNHKIRVEYIPLFYKQSATLAADINFNGQTYLKGDAVSSSLQTNLWKLGYEFDLLTSERGYIGAMAAVGSLNVSGAMADAVQSDRASVNIVMPGLGATTRYFLRPNLSVTGELSFFDLPGSGTHGHMFQVDGYAMYNFAKHFGVQAGYRSFATSHIWASPLNTGSMMIHGPYLGGTAHF